MTGAAAGVGDRRATPARYAGVAAAVAAAVLVVDQVTKVLAVATLEDSPVDLGLVRLAVTRNPGSAFGLLKGQVALFIVAAVAVTAVAVVSLRRPHGKATAAGLGLIVGGAWGNIVDRMTRAPGAPNGHVVDFIDFKVWPAFNVADSAIVIGAALIVLFGGRARERAPRA